MNREFIVEREGRTLVLYSGLLDQAHREGLKSIQTELLQIPSKDNGMTAIVRATVETSKGTFTGIGDANPDNVTKLIAKHLIRMSETRAKARALRDAINVGMVALEETDGEPDEEGRGPRAATQIRPDAGGPAVETPKELLAEIELHRLRLEWQETTLVSWMRSRTGGNGPDQLTREQAQAALAALGNIPDKKRHKDVTVGLTSPQGAPSPSPA